MKKLFVLFLLSSAAFVSKAQEVDFKIKLPLNQPYKAVTTIKMDMDGEQSMIMDMVMKSTITATKFENSNYTMENVTNAVKMDMDAGMMTMSYDSENPSDDPTSEMLGAQMGKVIGQKITMINSERGKVVSSETPEGIENAFDNMGMTASYPEKPVKPGDTWPVETTQKGIKTVANSKYIGKNAEGHQIETVGELFDEEDNKIGTFTSNYIIDPETFFSKSGTMKMNMDLEGQKIVTDLTMTVTK